MMSRQTQAILTMLLMLIVFSTTFAVDQAVIDDRAWDSPVFLRQQEIQTEQQPDLFDLGFRSPRLSPDRKSLELRNGLISDAAQDEVTNDGEYEYFYIDKPDGWVHPGKAVLLSALIPGAGELYAGSYWKSALFFAVEVGCWAAAINYGIRGEDKDTEFKNMQTQTGMRSPIGLMNTGWRTTTIRTIPPGTPGLSRWIRRIIIGKTGNLYPGRNGCNICPNGSPTNCQKKKHSSTTK